MLSIRKIYLFGLFSLFLTYSHAQSKLEIKIINLKNDNGLISLELLDANNQSVKSAKENIKEKKCTILIDNLVDGKYAIRFIHDENSNGKLDTNWMGIPTEGYGFSNDAYGTFGPKDFDEWLFDVKGYTKIILKTEY